MEKAPCLIAGRLLDGGNFLGAVRCLVSTLVICDLSQPSPERCSTHLAEDGGDRSPNTKAVTGYRTPNYCPKRERYSGDRMNERTISAWNGSPPKKFNFPNQKTKPAVSGLRRK